MSKIYLIGNVVLSDPAIAGDSIKLLLEHNETIAECLCKGDLSHINKDDLIMVYGKPVITGNRVLLVLDDIRLLAKKKASK